MEIRLAWVSFLLEAVFVMASCSSQHKMNHVDNDEDDENRQCFYRPKFTAEERMKNYPFRDAAQVILTSYEGGLDGKEPRGPDLERIVLRKSQIDSLTDVLYNNFYRGKFLTSEVMMCFNPRNAIVFVDASGKEFERADVCFECLNYETAPVTLRFGDDCNWKVNHLDSFFVSCGIKHGPQSNKPKKQH